MQVLLQKWSGNVILQVSFQLTLYFYLLMSGMLRAIVVKTITSRLSMYFKCNEQRVTSPERTSVY